MWGRRRGVVNHKHSSFCLFHTQNHCCIALQPWNLGHPNRNLFFVFFKESTKRLNEQTRWSRAWICRFPSPSAPSLSASLGLSELADSHKNVSLSGSSLSRASCDTWDKTCELVVVRRRRRKKQSVWVLGQITFKSETWDWRVICWLWTHLNKQEMKQA